MSALPEAVDTNATTRRFPIVPTLAAAGGALILAFTIALTTSPEVIEWAAIGTVAVLGSWLSFYDYRDQRLPDRITFPLYAAVGAFWCVSSVLSGDLGRLGTAAAAGVLLWVLYFVLAMLGGVAYGDVKLAGVLGLFVGWWGIIPALLATAAAYFLALPHGIISVVLGNEKDRQNSTQQKRRRHIPFGPYMVAGALAVAVWQIMV